MGKGLIPADQETWKVRRRAIVPGFHKAWYSAMCGTFVRCNRPLVEKLKEYSRTGRVLDMELEFCSVALDIIGKAVFNYDFGSVTKESPVIKAVYSTLKEVNDNILPFTWHSALEKCVNFMSGPHPARPSSDLSVTDIGGAPVYNPLTLLAAPPGQPACAPTKEVQPGPGLARRRIERANCEGTRDQDGGRRD